MSHYSKSWLFDEYKELYVTKTGTKPTDEEIKFLKKYFDPFNDVGAKKIYYMAIFRLKRGWLKFVVYFFIKLSLKRDFKRGDNLDTLVLLHRYFAKKMLNDAIKAYCKISD